MENKNQHSKDELLQAILNKSASEDQKEAFQKWLDEHPDHPSLFEKMKKIWDAGEIIHTFSQIDTDADWKKVKAKSKLVRPVNRFKKFYSIAATVLVLISIGFTYLYQTTPGFGKLSSLSTHHQKENITLADGSKVYLNRNSKIVFPKHFDSKTRKIKMEGEAYFQVQSDSSKPFIIESGKAIIKVLGTSFNVKTYKNNKVTVCVNSGKVSMENTDSKEVVFLTKGEKGTLTDTTLVESENKEMNYDAWKTGVLRFKDTPVPLMFKYIENFYHVKITNRCKRIETLKFSSVFNNVDLNKVIQELELHLRIKITKKRNHLLITEKQK